MKTEMTITSLPMNKIKLGRNSRLDTREDEITNLMASIKEQGLLQPVGVSKEGTGYELCYGNRRFLACSKLGWTKIPAVIHDKKNQADDDLRNLSENLVRRNISLQEAGRYMTLLKEQGLTSQQIGVRLGLPTSYIKLCIDSYHRIPAKFRKDIEVRNVSDKKRTIGKVSIGAARAILSAKSTYYLTDKDVKFLFKAARDDERFSKENINDYAVALKSGVKDPLSSVSKMTHVSVQFFIPKDYKEELEATYVEKGPYKSFSGLCAGILKGEKSLRLKNIRT